MLTVLLVVKLWAEVALLALLGQWTLNLLLGAGCEGNFAYQLLSVVTRPARQLVARCAPQRLSQRVVGALTALLLGLLWLSATVGKVWLCLSLGVAACQ